MKKKTVERRLVTRSSSATLAVFLRLPECTETMDRLVSSMTPALAYMPLTELSALSLPPCGTAYCTQLTVSMVSDATE